MREDNIDNNIEKDDLEIQNTEILISKEEENLGIGIEIVIGSELN